MNAQENYIGKDIEERILSCFGKFTGGAYLWPWKGGIQQGTATESYKDLYPIPSTDLIANPTLNQNTGYN